MIKCKTTRQIVVVEIRAVNALSHETCQIVVEICRTLPRGRHMPFAGLPLTIAAATTFATPLFKFRKQLKLRQYSADAGRLTRPPWCAGAHRKWGLRLPRRPQASWRTNPSSEEVER